MEKPGRILRKATRQPTYMAGAPLERGGELQSTAPTVELVSRGGVFVPAPVRRKRQLVLFGTAVFLVLALAATVYILRRAPAKTEVIAPKTADITTTAGNITATTATINWATDKPSASQVEYGVTRGYGSLSAFGPSPVTSHSVNLTALLPGTTYNYATLSTSPSGEVSTSPNFKFTTNSAAGSPAIGGVAVSSITTNSAIITWNTDQPLTSQVEYGTTRAYGALSVFGTQLVKSHSVTLTALAPGTTYNYAALSAGSTGQISTSTNFTFTTIGLTGAPLVSAVAAVATTTNSATIAWTTDQPSASQVEFGTTMAYGSLSVYGDSLVTSHSLTLNGLTPGTTYDYAVLSANSTGHVGTSGNFTFTTAPAPPVFAQVTATHITSTSAVITWTTDQPSGSQVEYGTTGAYGSLSEYVTPLVTSHSVTVHGLTPGTTYNYAAMSTNSAGMQNASRNQRLTTPRQQVKE